MLTWPPTGPAPSTGCAVSLLGVFPALERALDFTNHGPLVLISRLPDPDGNPSASAPRGCLQLAANRKVRNARRSPPPPSRPLQRSTPCRSPAKKPPPTLIARLAQTVLDLDRADRRASTSTSTAGFAHHQHAAIITSMAGIGDVLGAEFLAAIGGDLAGFASADHLAGYAGLAPAPATPGRRTGNLHRPTRYNRSSNASSTPRR